MSSSWTRESWRCVHLHHVGWSVQCVIVLLSYFVYPDFFMSNSAGVSRKAVYTYPTGSPGPCSQFLVKSELLIYFCYFVCIFSCFISFVVIVCVTVTNYQLLAILTAVYKRNYKKTFHRELLLSAWNHILWRVIFQICSVWQGTPTSNFFSV